MATFISHSPAETEALGEKWGRAATKGLVLALTGELGAGKTQLVKGLARGLGVTSRVHSPTFTLVNEYAGGRIKLFHLDLYRLETPGQIRSAGLEEFLQPDGVAVIEWAERLEAGGWKMEDGKSANAERGTRKTKTRWISVSIEIVSETDRKIVYDDSGA